MSNSSIVTLYAQPQGPLSILLSHMITVVYLMNLESTVHKQPGKE
jgi:hypothetical protein